MKILIFSHELGTVSESGSTCLALLQEYAKMPEIEVDLIMVSPDQNYHNLTMGNNVTIHQLSIGKKIVGPVICAQKESTMFAWQAFLFARKLVKIGHHDLVHVFFAESFGFAARLLKLEFKIPFLISFHGSDHASQSIALPLLAKLKKPSSKKIFNKASFVCADSAWLKNIVLSSDPKKEIEVVHAGVNGEIFVPKIESAEKNVFNILCVSEITPVKGVRFLIQAFKLLSGRYPQIRLLLVGDGVERQSLEDLVRALEIKERVEFIGKVEHQKVAEYFNQADVCVMPSLEEGISKVLAESLAAGVPVIAMENAMTMELLQNGVNGFIVKKSEADDLAEKIEKLILDQNLLLTLSKNSQVSGTELAWKSIAQKYLNLYVKTKNISQIQVG
jgi:glycosyltransferase involved in cell wall biosynthesis